MSDFLEKTKEKEGVRELFVFERDPLIWCNCHNLEKCSNEVFIIVIAVITACQEHEASF